MNRFAVRVALLVVTLVAGLLSGIAPSTAQEDTGRRTYTGTIDGAKYRVEMPGDWNGTLVLFSHGYYLPEWLPEGVELAGRPETEDWLLDHGYALAASRFKHDGAGYVLEDAFDDQLALLDWFEERIGAPRTTVTSGLSQGAAISTLLTERAPHRFDGLLTLCGEYDTAGSWNTALDITFVVKTLLAPGEDIDLVEARDPAASTDALSQAIDKARKTRLGRARLALAGALANIPAWYDSHAPEPTGLRARLQAQSLWTQWAYTAGLGPNGRADLESHAGGNPSWNVGVDYGRQLARSSMKGLVRKAYRVAGVEAKGDLRRLAHAPRIRPDAKALAYMYRHGVPSGAVRDPMITLHTTGDGGAITDQERWYAEQVRRHGDAAGLRQLYLERGGHCSFSPADEITALTSLLKRVDTGRWPKLAPRVLDKRVGGFDPALQTVLDLGTGEVEPMPPAFTRFTPPRFLRPSR